MQEAIERRNPGRARVPLEDVLVELRPEGFDEAFEADAVDLGLGGLAMRAAILPDVGSRLHCRFQSPHDGRCVDARAEVVWARDDGAAAGEFGLCFDALEPEAEASIRGFVVAWQSAMGLDVESSDHGLVSLQLEGVGPRLDADVVHRSGDVLVVEQGLPFLRLGKGVEEGGRLGRLESVDLRVEGDTPRLVLTVGFGLQETEETASSGDTLMDAPAPREASRAAGREVTFSEGLRTEPSQTLTSRTVPRDDVEVWSRQDARPEDSRCGEARSEDGEVDYGEADYGEAEAAAIARAEARQARETQREAETPRIVRTERGSVSEAPSRETRSRESQSPAQALEVRSPESRSLEEVQGSSATVEARGQALAQVRGFGLQVKAWATVVWAKVAPATRVAWARARHTVGSFLRRIGPFARVLAARARGKAAAPTTRKATPAPTPAARAPRRSTKAPGRESRGDEQPPRRGRMWIALGGVAAIATGSAIALAGGDEAAPSEVTLPTLTDPESGDVGAAPTEPGPAAATTPSVPTLEGGARPSSAPGELPPDSPYALDVASAAPAATPAMSSGATFGTAGTTGDELRMRMDGPIGGIRGERTDEGFRVVVAGVRAIDGARRLAAMSAAIERASILNESEGAVLNVRFVAGQSPAYLVRADGDALVVTVAR